MSDMPDAPEGAVPLPGGWMVLRDPEDVTERQRRPVGHLLALLQGQGFTAALRRSKAAEVLAAKDGTKAARQVADEANEAALAALTPEALTMLDDLNDASAAALVERWSYSASVTVEGLQSLPHKVYAAIRKATAKPALSLIPDFDPNPDPDSPSEPSQP